MDTLIYLLARALMGLLQALPLPWVARLGRLGGGAFYFLDVRHRRMAFQNLKRFVGQDKSDAEIRALAKENFRRIGENFCSAVKTAGLTGEEIRGVLEVSGLENLAKTAGQPPAPGPVFAIGHFGNFELYARVDLFLPGLQLATTYRGLRQPSLDRLLQSLRARSGGLYFERRTQAAELKEAMNNPRLTLGLLADQHAGDRGLRLPFFGEDCSTSAAPAVFALRYQRPLHTAICYRVAPGKWRIEMGPEIPTSEPGNPRPIADIMRDVNWALETAIRRDPANWFWVHNRWKVNKYRQPKMAFPPPADGAPSQPGDKSMLP